MVSYRQIFDRYSWRLILDKVIRRDISSYWLTTHFLNYGSAKRKLRQLCGIEQSLAVNVLALVLDKAI